MLLSGSKPGWWQRYLRWRSLPFAAWLVLLIGTLFAPLPLYSGQFNKDPDNYTRAVQVRDFVSNNNGWYDTRQLRLDPVIGGQHDNQQGIDVFSRLVDLPLAVVAGAAKPFVGIDQGIMIAAFIVPFMLLLPLALYVIGWAFRPWLGSGTWLLPVLALLYPGFTGEFMPGRIDHHSYQIVLYTAALGVTLRLLLADRDLPRRKSLQYGSLLGFSLAVSLAIGVEALPWLAVLLGVVFYALWQKPAVLQPAALAFAAMAPLATMLLLVALRTPAQFMQPTLYIISLVSVKLALAAGLTFALAAYSAARVADAKRRALAMAAIATTVGCVLLFDTPELLQGPWLGFDPWLVVYTSARVGEMQPLARFDALWPFVELLAGAALFGYWQGWQAALYTARPVILLLAVLSALLGTLTLFYAARLDRFWIICSLPGLFYALAWIKMQMTKLIEAHPKVALALAVLLAIAPLPWLGWQNYRPHSAQQTDVITAADEFDKCGVCLAGNFLTIAYPMPQRILTYGSSGPELIWRTPHSVIGGGIYNNAEGLKAALRFFLNDDPKESARVLQTQQIDLVYIRNLSYVAGVLALQTDDAYNRPLHANNPRALIQRLNRGDRFPWLQKLDVPFNTGNAFTIYRVNKSALADAIR